MEKQDRIDEFFAKMQKIEKFLDRRDVPELPIADDELWKGEIVPLLIAKGAIAKKDLNHNHWYYGHYRNSDFGRWNAGTEKFDHLREKFGYRWDACNHFEDDNGFALFVPLREATREEIAGVEQIIAGL